MTHHHFFSGKYLKSPHIILLVLIILAVATIYWGLLLTNTNTKTEITRHPRALKDFAEKVSISTFNADGKLANVLLADKMTRYLNTEIVEVQRPWLRIFTIGQPNVTIMANLGKVNADKSIVELINQARIDRDKASDTPEMQALSEYFKIFINEDVITTNRTVELLREESFTKADGMNYNNVTRRLDLYGKVHGSLTNNSNTVSKNF